MDGETQTRWVLLGWVIQEARMGRLHVVSDGMGGPAGSWNGAVLGTGPLSVVTQQGTGFNVYLEAMHPVARWPLPPAEEYAPAPSGPAPRHMTGEEFWAYVENVTGSAQRELAQRVMALPEQVQAIQAELQEQLNKLSTRMESAEQNMADHEQELGSIRPSLTTDVVKRFAEKMREAMAQSTWPRTPHGWEQVARALLEGTGAFRVPPRG